MKKLSAFLIFICMLASMLLLPSCSKLDLDVVPNGFYAPGTGGDSYESSDGSVGKGDAMESVPEGDDPDAPDDGTEGDIDIPEQGVSLPSGMITASAWNDNVYYDEWLALFSQDGEENGKFFAYTTPKKSWGYNSLDRVKVTVTSEDSAVAGAQVTALDGEGNKLFSAITDAEGNAYLFPNAQEGSITVSTGDETVNTAFTAEERTLSVSLTGKGNKLNVIEIMLVVDVTGSMSDEIDFLKAELADVVNRIAANDSETVIKLAMLFYRDHNDSVPFDYYDFTDVTTSTGLAQQQLQLNKQGASGGGDYPEAVDDALDLAVNKQWSTGATTKIIFHVLDAPAHDKTENKEKLENAVKAAAEKGIRLCPIICSGAAEVTEYTMREAAIYTGGTFIFVTDDSGIGGSHHDPGLPNATVELLNSLMVRLVKGYHTGEFEEAIYWKQDPNLAKTN